MLQILWNDLRNGKWIWDLEHLKGRNQAEDLGVDGRIILERILGT